jgi:hypothetical protein
MEDSSIESRELWTNIQNTGTVLPDAVDLS